MIMHRNRLIIRAITMITIVAAVAGCGDSNNSSKDSSAVTSIPVTTVVAEDQIVTPTLDYSGTVEPWAEAALGSEIPGRIEHLHCDVGDTVRAGFLIAELGSETLIQVRANYDAMEKDWNRIKSLHKAGTVSQQTYDRTQAAYDAAKATYEKTLASTRLEAPFTGVITHRYLDEGEIFTLMPGAAGSPAIVRLMLLDTVKVVISVSEIEYAEISKGQEALLVLDAHPDMEFAGKVSRIAPTLDTRSRTADVDVRFSNQDGRIRPGMFGVVTIVLEPRPVLLVNRDALIRQEGTGIFFTYKIVDELAVRVDVDKGDNYDNRVEIESGLEIGDVVITTGKMKVKTGSRVEIVSPEVTR